MPESLTPVERSSGVENHASVSPMFVETQSMREISTPIQQLTSPMFIRTHSTRADSTPLFQSINHDRMSSKPQSKPASPTSIQQDVESHHTSPRSIYSTHATPSYQNINDDRMTSKQQSGPANSTPADDQFNIIESPPKGPTPLEQDENREFILSTNSHSRHINSIPIQSNDYHGSSVHGLPEIEMISNRELPVSVDHVSPQATEGGLNLVSLVSEEISALPAPRVPVAQPTEESMGTEYTTFEDESTIENSALANLWRVIDRQHQQVLRLRDTHYRFSEAFRAESQDLGWDLQTQMPKHIKSLMIERLNIPCGDKKAWLRVRNVALCAGGRDITGILEAYNITQREEYLKMIKTRISQDPQIIERLRCAQSLFHMVLNEDEELAANLVIELDEDDQRSFAEAVSGIPYSF
ncbi:hypothetical protein NHQ30_011302 [Ciborinia camelliae]|nr:hypothetical protein NHQ30_011302 [Ciborinia camelliae]